MNRLKTALTVRYASMKQKTASRLLSFFSGCANSVRRVAGQGSERYILSLK